MDAELKEHLESMEGRLRADIVILEDRIMQRVDGRLDAVELRMTDAIAKADHELETKLIAEFWKWGRTSDLRTRQNTDTAKQAMETLAIMNQRLMNAEDRITELERRRPPAA